MGFICKIGKKRIDCEPNEKLIDEISQIIKGNFVKDSIGKYYYERQNSDGNFVKVPLKNIATGIKNFGIVDFNDDDMFFLNNEQKKVDIDHFFTLKYNDLHS